LVGEEDEEVVVGWDEKEEEDEDEDEDEDDEDEDEDDEEEDRFWPCSWLLREDPETQYAPVVESALG
jgi:hypothetical protein